MKVEKDGNVSILRIRDISSCDTGEIRCIATVNGKGPSASCNAKLQLQNSLYDFNDFATKPEDIQSHAKAKLSLTNVNLTGMPEKTTKLSSLKCRRHHEKTTSLTRTRSSSFPRCAASYTKHISPLPIRKRISNNVSTDIQKSQFTDDSSVQRVIKRNVDSNLFELSEDQRLSSSINEKNIIDTSVKLLSPKKTEQLCHQNVDSIPNERYVESHLKKLIKATIIKQPTDIRVFKGSRTVLKVTYQGCPEPTIKWLRVVGFIFSPLIRILWISVKREMFTSIQCVNIFYQLILL